METLKLILGTDNIPIVIAGTLFLFLGVLLRSLIKARFVWAKFVQTNWLKKAVGFACAAIVLRFLQQYYHVASEDTLLFIAFGLGTGSDLCIHAITKIADKLTFLKGGKDGN